MSRSGYTDSGSTWGAVRWRGAVKSAIRGKCGQATLRELLAALDALTRKRLIAEDLVTPIGECCALGALGVARGLDMTDVNRQSDCADTVGHFFWIPRALAAEIEYENDDGGPRKESPEARWVRMREWVAAQIKVAS